MRKRDDKSLVLLRHTLAKKFQKKIADEELNEIVESLFYLGRAIARFNKLKKRGIL
jgi:hypothetical protein